MDTHHLPPRTVPSFSRRICDPIGFISLVVFVSCLLVLYILYFIFLREVHTWPQACALQVQASPLLVSLWSWVVVGELGRKMRSHAALSE